MSIRVKQGGQWKNVTRPHVKEAGVWKKAKKVLQKDLGVWRTVWQAGSGTVPPEIEGFQCVYQTNVNINYAGTSPTGTWSIGSPSVQDGDVVIAAFALNVSTSSPVVTLTGLTNMQMLYQFSLTSVTSYWRCYIKKIGKGETHGSTWGGSVSPACAGQLTYFVYRPVANGTHKALWLRKVAKGSTTTTLTEITLSNINEKSPGRYIGNGYGTSGGTSFSWTNTGGGGTKTSRRCSLSATSQGRINCLNDWNLSTPFSGGSITFKQSSTTAGTLAAFGFAIGPPPFMPGGYVAELQRMAASGTGLSWQASDLTAQDIRTGDLMLVCVVFGIPVTPTQEPTISGASNNWVKLGTGHIGTTGYNVCLFAGHIDTIEAVQMTGQSGSSGGTALAMVFRGMKVPDPAAAVVIDVSSGSSGFTGGPVTLPCDNAPVVMFEAHASATGSAGDPDHPISPGYSVGGGANSNSSNDTCVTMMVGKTPSGPAGSQVSVTGLQYSSTTNSTTLTVALEAAA